MNHKSKSTGYVIIAILGGLSSTIAVLVAFLLFLLMGIGGGANVTPVDLLIRPLVATVGAPIIAPSATLGALAIWRSTRVPHYIAILLTIVAVVAAVASTRFFWAWA